MRLSIATRVTLACAALIGVSFLLLLLGLRVADGIHDANARVAGLSHELQIEGERNAAQQKLRLAVGDLTRRREQGVPVSDAEWTRLSHQIDGFASLNIRLDLPDEGSAAAADAASRDASFDLVRASRSLAAVARTDPRQIKRAMPDYLTALKRLESMQFVEQERLALEISEAVGQAAEMSHRDIKRVLGGGLLIVLIVMAMATWLRTHLLSPMVGIAARLREFNADAPIGPIPGLTRDDELGDLARGLAEYRSAVEERRVAERKADYLARHDVLTGLANRLQFEDRIDRELAHGRASGTALALLAIDLDNFKAINDRHGHAGGDRALKRAADILESCAGDNDLVARLGGDEFAILQIGAPQPASAEALAQRLLKHAAATAQEPIEIGMSIGMAVASGDLGREDLHNAADLALYRAKSDGRSRARLFDAALREQERMRVRLARDLEHAIARRELHLVYQPIADGATLRVIGYEALLRWRHPVIGEISPNLFVPVAESAGLIEEIGLWVVDQAFAAAAAWDDPLWLSLNLSPLQFRKPGFAKAVLMRARHHGLPLDRLEFEVTESAMLLGVQRGEVLQALQVLQAAGARIVMDDFGTGHSTLSNLKDFNFDKLKIDRSFIAELHDHESSALIVKTTIALAKSLGQIVVAEGVETPAQLAELKLWGCDQVQGYLIGRPQSRPEPGEPTQLAALSLAR
ncbi:putative bifunctional diguanylate cyclase/phosphodiesterase [Sphingomonas sp. S2-65]|uniref:putative bifunctional diguanylate cyclase/phosphodiesterase n=1 Tax=Sphingomonas sp. S2-65 TaxID=2903960 RepID=UPI001F45C89B|nr:EAL domain-containing protein [Sphingomonas sp. S2-65]UYY58245.1 EAL domain-containing protein [Sphingomonas sp. S2-65]